MANHKLAIEHAQWLGSVSQPRQQADQALLKAEQQAAQNRVLHTEIQLAKSQSLLGDFLPNFRYKNGKSIPVLPSDTPWVGKLNTMLEVYKGRGIVPARFNSIDDYLPKARQLIGNRADAVNASSRAAQQSKTAVQNGQSPIANLLEACRRKALNEQDFLSSVTGYNRAITDYVLSVRQDINQPKRLASVLIGKKSVQNTDAIANTSTPEEDLDSIVSDSDPAIRQVSTGQRLQVQPSGLPGRSAYQNEIRSGSSSFQSGSIGSSQETGSSSLTELNSSQPAAASSTTFEYGPTKESALASGFDPAKVRTELPMQQTQEKGVAPGYGSNTAQAGNVNRRSQANPVGGRQAQAAFNPRQGQRSPRQNNQAVQSSGGALGPQPDPQNQQKQFVPPVRSAGIGGGQAPAGTSNPFRPGTTAPGSSGPAAAPPVIPETTGASTFSPPTGSTFGTKPPGASRSLGGGAFGGGTSSPASATSRFNTGAGSSAKQ